LCELQLIVNDITECGMAVSPGLRAVGHSGACYAVPCCGG
jgi:hypothetical protein